MRPEPKALLLILGVALPVLFASLGSSSLWEPDEPRFAEASRQMLATGDWLTPSFNGQPRFAKPILIYWLQAASFALLGETELALRLPVALCGLASVLLVYALGCQHLGRRAGLLAALAFATSFRFVIYSRHGLTDVPLLCCMLGALYGFTRTLDDEPSRRWALVAWASLGLAMLTKGPVGLLPLPIWIAFLLVSRQLHGLGRLELARGLPLFAVTGLPWYAVMIWIHGRAYLDFALMREVVARYGSHGFHGPVRGLLYYFKVWPADAAPWTLFFLAALWLVASGWRGLDQRTRRACLFALTWFAVVLLVFSFSRYKLPHYLLPLYPALALTVGMLFDRAAEGRRRLAVSTWLTVVVCLALALASGLFLVRVFGHNLLSPAMLLPLAWLTGAAAMAVCWLRRKPLAVFASLAASTAISYLVLAAWIVPRDLERFKPIPPLSRSIVSQAREGDRIGLLHDVGQGFVYYCRRNVTRLHSAGEAAAFLAADGRAFLVVHSRDLEEVRRVAAEAHVLAARPLFLVRLSNLLGEPGEERGLVLLSNRPARPAMSGTDQPPPREDQP